MKPFKNEPLTDFTKPANRRAMEKALKRVERQLGREYPLAIGGRMVTTKETFISVCPAEPLRAVGVFHKADAAIAARAVETAYRAFQDWRFETPRRRAACLFKLAEIMRRRRAEFAAWMVFETGKAWGEADGEVAQAIEFCEFYGREALRYAERQPLNKVAGEKNQMVYIPLGVGAVIPPWNFAFSILAGMTVASLVAGNTVVLKPSSDSPTIAARFFEAAREAGLPDGVLNFVPGPGGVVGEALVAHPKTRFVAFTGSKAVGLRINQLAARQAPGQIWIKRTILEMGGKDAIVVASDADLDDAAAGVTASAFGFQGQKCSACSRAIVVDDVYDRFIEKLIPRVEAIKVGPATSLENTMGPVINAAAMKKIVGYIEIGRREGRLLTGGKRLAREGLRGGFFIEPTVIADVAPDARIAQEEIFGPVLAVIRARDYYHALEIANNTEYGLTGAVYTRSPEKIALAKEIFHVGNLYFNRRCTGYLVGAHPFGGFNLSGTDSKAGGRDYLLLFLQAKSMSEKIVNKVKPGKPRPRR
ncbi:MAG: L-glutamate gamma-semialdehyde dehydrogenase [bacterium]